MRMAEVFDRSGKLLGHVDLDLCRQTPFDVIVENMPAGNIYPLREEILPSTEVEIARIQKCRVYFKDELSSVKLMSDDLPAWFWTCRAAVKFEPQHAQPIR